LTFPHPSAARSGDLFGFLSCADAPHRRRGAGLGNAAYCRQTGRHLGKSFAAVFEHFLADPATAIVRQEHRLRRAGCPPGWRPGADAFARKAEAAGSTVPAELAATAPGGASWAAAGEAAKIMPSAATTEGGLIRHFRDSRRFQRHGRPRSGVSRKPEQPQDAADGCRVAPALCRASKIVVPAVIETLFHGFHSNA
jgi:hypothetical protein